MIHRCTLVFHKIVKQIHLTVRKVIFKRTARKRTSTCISQTIRFLFLSSFLQAHAGEILTALKKLVPKDAFAVGAVTACDLYPRDSWNFVFGLASLSSGVGVYSLARYLPSFPSSFQVSQLPSKGSEEWTQLLKRTCRVMVHEMCHMFGLKHCIFYSCLMNGSNHFEESERRPLGLCPICLRKLHLACRFPSLRQRFERLQAFCDSHGLRQEAEWFQRRLQQ